MDKKYLQKVANELFIALTDSEADALLVAFKYFSTQAKLLENIKGIDEAEPLIFPFPVTRAFLREDIVVDTPTSEEILKNSRNAKDGFVIIPKVVK